MAREYPYVHIRVMLNEIDSPVCIDVPLPTVDEALQALRFAAPGDSVLDQIAFATPTKIRRPVIDSRKEVAHAITKAVLECLESRDTWGGYTRKELDESSPHSAGEGRAD